MSRETDADFAREILIDRWRGRTVDRISHDEATGIWYFNIGVSSLSVECPWRIVTATAVALTNADHNQQFGLPTPVNAEAEAARILASRRVSDIRVDPATGDLQIRFDHFLRLEMWVVLPATRTGS
jgi:hypothetical protein